MGLAKTLSAFSDCEKLLEQALNSPNGIRVRTSTRGMAVNLRQRIYRCRSLLKKDNAKLYPDTDPMHATTVYDALAVDIVKLEDGDAVEIKIRAPLEVEEL